MSTTFSRSLSLMACALLLVFSMPAWADDLPAAEEEAVEDPTSAYQNAAQAQHDANLAAAAYEKDLAIDAEIANLQEQLDDAEENGNSGEVERLTGEIDALVSQRIGLEEGEISQMRADGMGWGEIAHELGLHPSVLGLGHTKKTGVTADVAMATAVDMKSGNGLGHGKSADAAGGKVAGGKSNAGKGQDKDKGDHGNKGGNGGNHGNGGGNKNK